VEGAEDSLTLLADDLKARDFCDRDVFCGIAASGRTPYVIGGLDYANSIGAATIAVACNVDTAVGKKAKVVIEVDAGSEVLTGSTRLKAGTAQKIILNMISTGAMIQVGKVYKNLMVDVLTTNEKLVDRAMRIVMRATGADYATADATLKVTANKAKPAIVMLLNKCSFEEATAILAKNNGFIQVRP
jgi:N-acetylmuramic acid 6-phosphate etherase